MKAERIAKIEQISKDLLYGKVNPMSVLSLPPFDRLCVLTGWALCVLTTLGALSVENGKKIHLKQLQDTDYLIRNTEIFLESYHRWQEYNLKTCTLRTTLYKKMRDSVGTDIEEIMTLVAKLLDTMDRVDIYSKLMQQKLADEKFKINIMQAFRDNIDIIIDKFGSSEEYLRMLESFFHACKEDKVDELYAYLEPDNLIAISEELPPKATDEERDKTIQAVKDNLNTLYSDRYRP